MCAHIHHSCLPVVPYTCTVSTTSLHVAQYSIYILLLSGHDILFYVYRRRYTTFTYVLYVLRSTVRRVLLSRCMHLSLSLCTEVCNYKYNSSFPTVTMSGVSHCVLTFFPCSKTCSASSSSPCSCNALAKLL